MNNKHQYSVMETKVNNIPYWLGIVITPKGYAYKTTSRTLLTNTEVKELWASNKNNFNPYTGQ
jgi:hypothetical protein